MSIADKTRRYYSWIQVWSSKDNQSSKALELAFYKLNIAARMEQIGEDWILRVPWIYEEIAITAIQAYREGQFEYPSEIQMNERWESYNRFKPHKFKGRTYKTFLVLGIVLLLMIVIRTLYGAGLFR